MRESDIEKYLVECVKALGGEVRKVKWIGRRGAPDRLVMLPGRWIKAPDKHVMIERDYRRQPISFWAELKAPGKEPEAHQLREHERMRRMGQHVEVIDSLEGVDRVLA